MIYRKQWILAVVMLLLLSVVSVGGMAQESETGAHTGLRPDAPPYAVRGTLSVGTRDLVISGQTPLDITVWYPALNADHLEEAITYPYTIKMDAPPGVIATVAGHALSEAPYELSAGPYPLVVLSPGFIIGRTAYAWLAEHLASYGFVVIAPEHQERLDPTMSEFWSAAMTRPQDVHTVLDYAEAQAGAGGTLEGLIDIEHVAVIGHSYGGYTSLVMAGARFDIDSLNALCETAHAASDPNAWLCDLIIPHVAEMAKLAGLASVPEGLWPAGGASRVDAIVPMAGDAFFFNQAGLAEITVPVMAIGGTADAGAPYEWGTHPTYEYVSSPTKALVAFENADHMIFGSTCAALPFYAQIGFYAFCSDPVWEMDRAHDLINHFTTAFLLAELKQDPDATAALAPEGVHFPGVTYEAQGF